MRPSFIIVTLVAALTSGVIAWYGSIDGQAGSGDQQARTDIASLTRQTAAQPENFEAWKTLAVALRNAGRADEALHAYIRASRLRPGDTGVILALRDLTAGRN